MFVFPVVGSFCQAEKHTDDKLSRIHYILNMENIEKEILIVLSKNLNGLKKCEIVDYLVAPQKVIFNFWAKKYL